MEDNVAEAARRRDWKKVRRLVACGYDVNEIASKYGYGYPCSGGTALHYSLLMGQVEISELLLKRGANVSAADANGRQPFHHAADADDNSVAVCQLLFDLGHGADITAVNAYGETPLHIASRRRKEGPEVCKILLKHDAKVDALNEYGQTSLHLACEKGNSETVCLLLSHGADVRAVDHDGKTQLHIAASRQKECPEVCKILLKHGAKANALNEYEQTSMHLACENGYAETVCLLLSHGADVRAVDYDGKTPLHAAVSRWKEYPEVCKILLKHSAKVDALNEYGQTSLHLACKNGHAETVSLLLSHGADVMAVDRDGKTPLHAAAGGDRECPKLCAILLKQETNINAMDKYGQQPLHLACKKGYAETGCLLLSHGADVRAIDRARHTYLLGIQKHLADSKKVFDTQGNHALHIASRDGMSIAVQLFVDLGADTNAVNKHGQTPLHMAADREKDCPELCKILLKHAAKIDASDEDGNQPLHLGCNQSHTNTGSLLLSHGADVRAVDHVGQTPLHMAAGGEKDCPKLCEILLKHTAKIDVADEDGNQPLHLACNRGHTNTGSLLLSHGADVRAVDHVGQTPLHMAAGGEKDCPKLCEILLKHAAKIDVADEDGNQPLHLGCNQGHTNTGSLLLSHGADVRAVDHVGQTPLHMAAGGEKDCPKLCEILLKHTAKIDVADEDGNQPLHLACNRGHTNTGSLLLSHGADVRAVDHVGQTPLHMAAGGEKDCPKLCEILLKHAAKIDVADEDGNQPLHLACNRGHTNTGSLLLSRGADVRAVDHVGHTALLLFSKHITGSQIIRVDTQGNYALHIASRDGMSTAVQLLVDLGADTNAVNKHGQTPLHMAADREKNCPELCEILLKHAAKINAVDDDGNQPLHLTCNRGHTNTGSLLLSHGANINAANRHGQSPLHVVAGSGIVCQDMCEILLKHGAQLDATDKDGKQPLHVACERESAAVVELLLSWDADVQALDCHGDTPDINKFFMAAVKNGWISACQLFLEKGANPNYTDDGFQPLTIAAENYNTELCRLLLVRGATIPVDGRKQLATTLRHAIVWDMSDLTKLLLSHGMDIRHALIGEQPVLERSKQKGTRDMAQLLQAAGISKFIKLKCKCAVYLNKD